MKMLKIPEKIKRWVKPTLLESDGKKRSDWHEDIPEEWLVDAPVSAFEAWNKGQDRPYVRPVTDVDSGYTQCRKAGWNAAIDEVVKRLPVGHVHPGNVAEELKKLKEP